jgi:hypothetical protein
MKQDLSACQRLSFMIYNQPPASVMDADISMEVSADIHCQYEPFLRETQSNL